MIDHWLPRNKSSIKPAIFHRHFCVSRCSREEFLWLSTSDWAITWRDKSSKTSAAVGFRILYLLNRKGKGTKTQRFNGEKTHAWHGSCWSITRLRAPSGCLEERSGVNLWNKHEIEKLLRARRWQTAGSSFPSVLTSYVLSGCYLHVSSD